MGTPRILKNYGLWTGLLLFSFAWSVQAFNPDEIPMQGLKLTYSAPERIDPSAIMAYLKMVMEDQRQKAQTRSNIPDMSYDNMMYNFQPMMPIRPGFLLANDDKRAMPHSNHQPNYQLESNAHVMNLCHFKICPIGKRGRRGNLRK